ncbi:hypothetical protein GOBAR_AA20940 [Gossypium barbadense]|uniref:Uncharacterized protein n=1 Tax=Gossypium barbadense TaxID=3634 RepID=A0A2P5X8P2_GOSBA|nr:hypothetical protein GOBAR_AA20940 [Gossypium barbadense]
MEAKRYAGVGGAKETALKKDIGFPNEMHQPRVALHLTPQGSEMELNLSWLRMRWSCFTRCTIPWIVLFDIVMEDIAYYHQL